MFAKLLPFAVVLLLAGCGSPGVGKTSSVTPPAAQPAPTIPAAATVTSRRAATAAPTPQSVVIPGPDPLLRTIAWCYPAADLPFVAMFRIYQTTNLTPPVVWTFFTNVPAPALSVSFRGTLPQQFFIMTAVDASGSESGYNVKRACE